MSLTVNLDILHYMEISRFEFIKEMRLKFHGQVSTYFDSFLFTQVYTAYKSRFTALQRRFSFNIPNKPASELSICLTYIARYGTPETPEYIKNHIDSSPKSKQKFYLNILRCIEKFGYSRLYDLAIRRRNRILSYYSEPIKFESLNFTGRTSHQSCNIINFNKNRKSKIAAFISLNVPFRAERLDIPIKLSIKHHGHPESYRKYIDRRSQYSYSVIIDELTKSVAVHLTKETEPIDYTPGTSYIGIDVNVKHNLLSLSDGSTYDFDRKLIKAYLKVQNKIEASKAVKPDYKPGRNRQIQLRHYARQIKHNNERLVVKVCQKLKSQGYDHIVMENLTKSFKKSGIVHPELQAKYNRIASILNICSIKDLFRHIAPNYGLSVSLVHSEYTSQQCPVCGHISQDNRPNQETFKCQCCGHYDNADHNAAVNIVNRVRETVFREALLKSNPDGTYIPKPLQIDEIRDILLRSSQSKTITGL